MISESELHALVKLLDDPDREIYEHVEDKLLSFGPQVVPMLETTWENEQDSEVQQRIEQLIHKIQFISVKDELEAWMQSDDEDILKGAITIAKYQYPDLDEKKVYREVEMIKRDIWLELSDNLTPLEQITVFNNIFYKLHKISNKVKDFMDPHYFYINNVVESKTGNQFTLGILYLSIAQELGMPIYGVILPHQFILAYYKTQLSDFSTAGKEGVLFYVNPFNKGMIFTKNEIKLFLAKIKVEPDDIFYIPSSNKTVLKELLAELGRVYKNKGEDIKSEEIKELVDIITGDDLII